MSGTSDAAINIRFVATTADFQAATASARAAMDNLAKGMTEAGRAASSSSQMLRGMAQAGRESALAATLEATAHQAAGKAAHEHAGGLFSMLAGMGVARSSAQELEHSVRAMADGLAAGIPPTRLLMMELPRVTEALSFMGGGAFLAIGGIVALGVVLYEGIGFLTEYSSSVHALQDAMVDMGTSNRDGGFGAVQAAADRLQKQFVTTATAANELLEPFMRIPGINTQMAESMAAAAAAMARYKDISLASAAEEVAKAFEKGPAGAIRFAENVDALSASQKALTLEFMHSNDVLAADAVIVQALTERYRGYKEVQDQVRSNQDALAFGAGSDFGGGMGAENFRPVRDVQRENVGPPAETPEHRAAVNTEKEFVSVLAERAELTAKIAKLQWLIHEEELSEQGSSSTRAALDNAQLKLRETVDPSVADKLKQQLEAIKSWAAGALQAAEATTKMSSALKTIRIPADQQRLFEQSSAAHGVPLPVLGFVGQHESGFNANQGTNAYGATGEMQFKPETFRSISPSGDINKASDQIDAAGKLLRQLFEKFGTWEEAVSHYGTFSTGKGPAADQGVRDQFRGQMNQEGVGTGGGQTPAQIQLEAAKQSYAAIAAERGADTEQAREAALRVTEAERAASRERTEIRVQQLRIEEGLDRDDIAKKIEHTKQQLDIARAGGPQMAAQARELEGQLERLEQEHSDRVFDIQTRAVEEQVQLQRRAGQQNIALIQQRVQEVLARYGEESAKYQAIKEFEVQVTRRAEEEKRREQDHTIDQQVQAASHAEEVAIRTANFQHSMGALTIQQSLDAQIKAAQQALDVQMTLLRQKEILNAKDEQALQATLDKEFQLQQQYQDKITQLVQQKALQQLQAYQHYADATLSSVGSAVSGMIFDHQSLAQSVASIAKTMTSTLFDELGKMASKWIITHLLMETVTKATKSAETASVITSQTLQTASAVSGQTLQTAATTAGVATRMATTAAASAAGKAMKLADDVSTITSDAGTAAAGAYASAAQTPIVGWTIAPGAAAAALAAVMGFASIASAAGGFGDVPFDDMPALLHKNEMVLPAHLANPLRDSLSDLRGGEAPANPQAHYSINYAPSLSHAGTGQMSRKEAEAFFSAHAPALVKVMTRAQRDGAFRVPRH